MAGRPAKPNMYDVARLAGVSHQTVSRVINDSSSVREDTRSRVLDAMQALGYVPNQAARALVTAKSNIIGILASNTYLYGPAGVVHAMEMEARRLHYVVVTCSVDPSDVESVDSGIGYLRGMSVDGVVVVSPHSQLLDKARNAMPGLPVLGAGYPYPGDDLAVSVDNQSGSAKATQHLIDLGHRNIVHFSGPEDWLDSRSRATAYSAAMVANGLLPRIVEGDWGMDTGYRLGREFDWLGSGVTAVYTANDHLAIGLMKALGELGISVPGQVSVVGFDDIPEAAFLTPGLTTVRQDFSVLGQRAMRILISRIAQEPAANGDDLAPELVIRESTAKPSAL